MARTVGRPAGLICFILMLLALWGTSARAEDCVVLLHGLNSDAQSMAPAADYFQRQGFSVVNVDYPTLEQPIQLLAERYVPAGISACGERRVHFVTHSMGGILLRHYLARYQVPRLGRVVMLGPPNGGSEIVDAMNFLGLGRWIKSPAGWQLNRTASSLPNRLGPAGFEVGVVAGAVARAGPLGWLLPGDNDGFVTVSSTRLRGMADHMVMPYSHGVLPSVEPVLEQSAIFLRRGHFLRDTALASAP